MRSSNSSPSLTALFLNKRTQSAGLSPMGLSPMNLSPSGLSSNNLLNDAIVDIGRSSSPRDDYLSDDRFRRSASSNNLTSMNRNESSINPTRVFSRFARGRYIKFVLVFVIILLFLLFSRRFQPEEVVVKTNYGLLIDAGSSGTRIYIYKWKEHSGDADELLNITSALDRNGNPLSMKIEPGISSYSDDLQGAYNSISKLLDFAMEHVPHHQHIYTPLHILATAGMRLLPLEQQSAIQSNIVQNVAADYDFQFRASNMEVISGKMEGVYAWITVNYLLQRFRHQEEERPSTAGIIDMGGASTQIAFETPWDMEIDDDSPFADHIVEIDLGCGKESKHSTPHGSLVPIHKYRIFSTTYLGFGANQAYQRYYEHLIDIKKDKLEQDDPCGPPGLIHKLEHNQKTYSFKGIGKYDECRIQIRPLLNISETCISDMRCSFNDVQRPLTSIDNMEFWGLAEYWYTSRDIFQLEKGYNQTIFDGKAENFCKTNWTVLRDRLNNGEYPESNLKRLRTQCFKAAWMSDSLHLGHGFSSAEHFTPVSVLNGVDVQWTLGAMLHLTRFQPLRHLQTVTSHSGTRNMLNLDSMELAAGGIILLLIIVCSVIYYFILQIQQRNRYRSTVPPSLMHELNDLGTNRFVNI